MRWILAGFVVLHGLIHFMGPAKAFGLAELPQLTQPVSRGMALVWLAAGLLFLVTAVLIPAAPRAWWMTGTAALVLSQAAIASSWSDAKYGTLANVIILAAVVYSLVSRGR